MLLDITHVSNYRYSEPLQYGLQQLRLTPVTRPGQTVQSWTTTVEGGRTEVIFTDHHLNRVELVSFTEGAEELRVTSTGTVETTDTHGILPAVAGEPPRWLFRRSTEVTTAGPHVHRLVDDLDRSGDRDVELLHELSGRIAQTVQYESGRTTIHSTAEDALQGGAGVCQDHANVFLSAARVLGHPARYVSGYLSMDGQINQEASHAWAEVWVDDLGWVGFDVSNGISPDDRYVRLATGLDYRDAAPISGIRFGSSTEQLDVSVSVQQ